MVSSTLTTLVVAADIGLALLLLAGIGYGAAAERRSSTSPRVLPFAAAGAVVAGWVVVGIVLARGGAFETDADTAVPLIGLGIGPPIVLLSALLAVPGFRARLARVPLHWLVGVQFYRVGGGLFLIAYLQNDMPAEFALPAGIGDVLVGLSAPFVAYRLARHGPVRARPAVLTWCALGIADLVVAVTCGFLTAPSSFQQLALDAPNTAITSYPFVLIPIFAVPVSVVLHIYVIARMREHRRPGASAGSPNPSPTFC